MRLVMVLFASAVCYVSLPLTWQVAAVGQPNDLKTAVEEPTPTESDDDEPKEKAKSETAKSDKAGDADEKKSTSSDEKQAAEKKAERKTAKADKKRLRVVVTLEGTFAASKMTPVELRPEEWSQFEIEEIVKHGAEVHAGQTLVKFDKEKFEEELAELQLQLNVSELAIRRAEEELPRLEKSLDMAATEAERNDKHAHEDFDRFFKIDRPMLLKAIDYQLKSAQFQLDYAQDELDQLEKMYEADDLTEDTEEIVLKRSRTEVEFAKFTVEQTKEMCDELLKIRLPRYEIEIKESLDKAALALAQAKTSLALDLNRARYDLEQLRETRKKSVDRHAKLLADRALMELEAPADGIVYYGECDNGNWADIASLISKYEPHGTIAADSVVMTIIERRPLEVVAQAGEAQRPELSVGQSAKIVPPMENSAWLPAKLESISAVPVATGKYNAEFDLAGAEVPDWVVAGMSCKVKITTFDKKDALVVPAKAVHTDKDDEEVKYVWLVPAKDSDAKDEKAKAERRNVKLGKASGDNVEVIDGLKAGDVVSLEDEEKKAEEAK